MLTWLEDVFNISKHIVMLATLSHVTNNSSTDIKYHNEISYSSDGGDRTDGVDKSDGGDENLNL